MRKSLQNELALKEGEYSKELIGKETKLNLQSLLTIDDKLNTLADYLKKPTNNQISQLCSDWWELTDEAEYAIA